MVTAFNIALNVLAVVFGFLQWAEHSPWFQDRAPKRILPLLAKAKSLLRRLSRRRARSAWHAVLIVVVYSIATGIADQAGLTDFIGRHWHSITSAIYLTTAFLWHHGDYARLTIMLGAFAWIAWVATRPEEKEQQPPANKQVLSAALVEKSRELDAAQGEIARLSRAATLTTPTACHFHYLDLCWEFEPEFFREDNLSNLSPLNHILNGLITGPFCTRCMMPLKITHPRQRTHGSWTIDEMVYGIRNPCKCGRSLPLAVTPGDRPLYEYQLTVWHEGQRRIRAGEGFLPGRCVKPTTPQRPPIS